MPFCLISNKLLDRIKIACTIFYRSGILTRSVLSNLKHEAIADITTLFMWCCDFFGRLQEEPSYEFIGKLILKLIVFETLKTARNLSGTTSVSLSHIKNILVYVHELSINHYLDVSH